MEETRWIIMGLPKKIEELSSNLTIDKAPKDEVLLHLDLVKMVELANPIPPSDMVVGFNRKAMRTNPELPKGDLKGMHLVPKCVGGANNNVVS
jgi:hypothetical protein